MASKKSNNILLYAFVVVVVAIALLFTFSTPKGAEIFSKLGVGQEPLSGAATLSKCNPAPHASILITGDADFTAVNGVSSGSGTASDPYVFNNLKFDDLTPGYGLKVVNTGAISKFFSVNCIQSSFKTAPPIGINLIDIEGVHQGTSLTNVDANSGEDVAANGILLKDSSNIFISDVSINKFGKNGVSAVGSDHITIVKTKLKAMENGFEAIGSSFITLGQPCKLNTASGDCNEFTYDDGRGVLLDNTHDVEIIGTVTSADDTGGVLFKGTGTYNVYAHDGISGGDGSICQNGIPTGLKEDTMSGFAVAFGAHDIKVRSYTVQGSNHFNIMNGGDGIWPDPCSGQNVPVPVSPPGGSNIDFNGICYSSQFGFSPPPSVSCPKS